jgi:hypothetical protein
MKRKKPKLGATGRFPLGQLSKHDEGELAFITYVKNNAVCLEFGKSVKWFGMPPALARQLAGLLIKHADSIDGLRTESPDN